MTTNPYEHWSSGDIYEQFMGRWSRAVANRFLDWIALGTHKRWLDVGCGTGALTNSIFANNEPQTIIALDSSLSFAHFALQQTHNAHFIVGTGAALPLVTDTFDAVVSGLVLNFIPDPVIALKEMRRVVKPGGIVAAYVWDYADKMEFLRYFWDVAVDLNSEAEFFHEGRRFPICHPDKLSHLWHQVDLRDVVVDSIDINTTFGSFEDYWRPFTRGHFPAPNYLASLDESRQQHLKDQLQLVVPTASDGSVNLTARVWAVRGFR